MNSHSYVKNLSIPPTWHIFYPISKHQFITVSTVLIHHRSSLLPSDPHTSPSYLTVRSITSSLSPSAHPFLPDLTCTFYRSDLFFILSESSLPEQQRLLDNLIHNLTCCRLLFPVIFEAILFNSCDRILHHSVRINSVFQRIFR